MLTWTRNLATAPKAVPAGMALLVILPGNDFPEAVHWVEYDDDLKAEVGEDGYWTYREALVADATDDINPEEIEDAIWALLPLPEDLPEQLAER